MEKAHDLYVDLIKRIEEMYDEIDNEVVVGMLDSDEEYAAIRKKVTDMQEAHPFIPAVIGGEQALSLTAEEHGILLQYLDLVREVEDVERRQIYFRGHSDCFAYLKRIGAI